MVRLNVVGLALPLRHILFAGGRTICWSFLKCLSDINTIWFPFWFGMDPAREGFGTSRFLLARD
jgi:hypothetical protein